MSAEPARYVERTLDLLLAADPLWWLRDPAEPRHLSAAVTFLGTRVSPRDADRVRRALRIASVLAPGFRLHVGDGAPTGPWVGDDGPWDEFRRDPEALATIRESLADRWYGPEAVRALASRWPDDPATLPTLVALASDVKVDTRAAAVEALATHWPHRPDVRALVLARFTDSDGGVRHTAVERAAVAWPDGVVRRLILERAFQDRHPDVRALALGVLVSRWPDEPGTLDALRARAAGHRATRDRDVARQLLRARYGAGPLVS